MLKIKSTILLYPCSEASSSIKGILFVFKKPFISASILSASSNDWVLPLGLYSLTLFKKMLKLVYLFAS